MRRPRQERELLRVAREATDALQRRGIVATWHENPHSDPDNATIVVGETEHCFYQADGIWMLDAWHKPCDEQSDPLWTEACIDPSAIAETIAAHVER